jgi:hypothetical protein
MEALVRFRFRWAYVVDLQLRDRYQGEVVKSSYVVILVLGAVVVTAGVQEARMAALRESLKPKAVLEVDEPKVPKRSSVPDSMPERRLLRGDGPVRKPKSDNQIESEVMTKSIRKMWGNPAGKSMMNQGVKVAVAMMYEDFIETLDLSDEEAKHFRELLGSEMMSQKEIGMKMMSATPEERKALAVEMEAMSKESEEAIKTFLNHEEDFDAFKDFKDRLPERQQIEGVRATMVAKNAAMDEATEASLIEAMHKVRTQPGLADFSGAAGLEEMSQGNAVGRFEATWSIQQKALREEVDFLSEVQREAFFEHQEQMKEFQLMGLKMADKMMRSKEE